MVSSNHRRDLTALVGLVVASCLVIRLVGGVIGLVVGGLVLGVFLLPVILLFKIIF